MNKKIHFSLILEWLLILYLAYRIFFLKGADIGTLKKYTDIFRQWALLVSLFLFWGCVWSSKDQLSEKEDVQARLPLWISWLVGLLLSLGVVLSLFVYVDPHGRLIANRFPSIVPAARAVKIEFYKNLGMTPEIIIMGSSRAFTLSPKYLEKQTGYETFNMAVDKGRTDDFGIQLKYILNQSDSFPYILIIEFNQGSLPLINQLNPDTQPISLISYMPFNSAVLVVEATVKDTFSLQALSDSIYLLTLPDIHTADRKTRFEADGLGIIKPVEVKEQKVKKKKSNHGGQFQKMYCDSLPNELNKQGFEDMLSVALENNIGIVLYESPMNGAYYDAAYNADPERFTECRQILREYLGSLATTHPNVFFRDLSGYEAVNSLEENGFFDIIHLKPVASEMVIDALLPDIESAMAWAREKRNQPSP